MAFLLVYPTIGYYTLATYVNAMAPDSSTGGILIRAFVFATLILVWLKAARSDKTKLGGILLPATLFMLVYSYRLVENIAISGLEILPGNDLVVLTFIFSCVFPSFILASLAPSIRDQDMVISLSTLAILFVVGLAINHQALAASAELRMSLDKVNPIALAYVASSFLLFYLLTFSRSNKMRFQAVIVVPVLLVVISLARSRGMIISTGLAIAVYIILLRGTHRIWAIAGLTCVAVAIGVYANPEYFAKVTDALGRINIDTDISTATRALAFRGAWSQFLADPLFGRYINELQTSYYPHNIYIESLMSVGLTGAIPFFVHFFFAANASVRLLRSSKSSMSQKFISLLFVRDAIGAAASGAIWSSSGLWITSFLIIISWRSLNLEVLRDRRIAIHRVGGTAHQYGLR